MSSSYLIGTIPLDQRRVSEDLAQVDPFGFVDSYTEFICGSWRTCMLWNATGDSGDVRICDYQGPARMTELGRKLGYLEELMTANFDLSTLRFARITRLAAGSVALPHRDYVELSSEFVRIHVPLMTDSAAYASEEETVYRMGLGEVWFLDATKVHSIGNFSQQNRIHLLLDFDAASPSAVLAREPQVPGGLPAVAVVPRRPLRDGEREAFLALGQVLDEKNFMDVMALLIKRYFTAEMTADDVFAWMTEIAERSGDPGLADRARSMRERSLISR